MTSFISTLSLFLLVLANGYLTLPIDNEQFQTSTMLSFNVDATSERPLIPRELLMDQVQQSTESLMELQMTTSTDNLPESASQETRTLKETIPLAPWLLTNVESTTADDNDITTEDNTTMESQSEPQNEKREALVELTTDTIPLTSTSSTNSLVNPELTTEESSNSKSSKKFTGLLKDKKDGEKDLALEKKEQDDEDQKLVKPSKTDKKEKEDDKEKSDDDDKEKSSKTHKKEKEDDKEKSDDEDKEKPSKTNKKEKEDDKEKSDDEDKEKSSKKHKKEKEDGKEKSDEDSKKSAAPIAQLDSEGMKDVSNYQKEYMDLDENSAFAVTQSGSTDSTTTLKYKKGKKPLNEGEESSTAKEEESNQ